MLLEGRQGRSEREELEGAFRQKFVTQKFCRGCKKRTEGRHRHSIQSDAKDLCSTILLQSLSCHDTLRHVSTAAVC